MANKDFKVKNGLDISTPLPVSMGGTGQTSTTNTLNSLLPSQAGNSAKVLQTDGDNTSWVTLPNGYSKGNTASRPNSPSLGDIYSNTQTGYIEVYTSAGWSQLGVIPMSATIGTPIDVGTNVSYGSGSVDVVFTPNVNGGLASSFTAVSSPGSISASGSSSPVRVTGLTQGTAYTFTVTATNGYGNALASSSSSSITPTSVPQAPTIGTATMGNAKASVTFTANATGGKAITSYTVTSSPGNITASGVSSPIVVTGLTNGTAYTFTVKANNANGASIASSASNSVTPAVLATVSGGTLSSDSTYYYNTFKTSGTLTVSGASLTADILTVAGGGGGGWSRGGGGGAGAIVYKASQSLSPQNYTTTIGAGGGASNWNYNAGFTGNNTVFGSLITAYGGGGGGNEQRGGETGNGGSGGGGGGNSSGTQSGGSAGTGGTGGTAYVNSGGYGTGNYNTGGGGGAGASGGNAGSSTGGDGGNGLNTWSSWATATSTGDNGYYAGGGSGRSGAGGSGATALGGGNGTANTGGGGVGGYSGYGGDGGSGIIIVRYLKTAVDW